MLHITKPRTCIDNIIIHIRINHQLIQNIYCLYLLLDSNFCDVMKYQLTIGILIHALKSSTLVRKNIHFIKVKWVSLGSKRDAGFSIFCKRDTWKSNYCRENGKWGLAGPGKWQKKMRITYIHSISGIRESDKTISGIQDQNPPMRPPVNDLVFFHWNLYQAINISIMTIPPCVSVVCVGLSCDRSEVCIFLAVSVPSVV